MCLWLYVSECVALYTFELLFFGYVCVCDALCDAYTHTHSVRVCVCICVYACVCVCVCICDDIYVSIYVRVGKYVCMHGYVGVCDGT